MVGEFNDLSEMILGNEMRFTLDCKKCDNIISDERIHLGYDTCLKCSDTEKYVFILCIHIRQSGYIQPMSSEQ